MQLVKALYAELVALYDGQPINTVDCGFEMSVCFAYGDDLIPTATMWSKS